MADFTTLEPQKYWRKHKSTSTVVFLTFAGYTARALQPQCSKIVFWLASVMIVSNKPTKLQLLAMACKMQTVTGFNLAISKTAKLVDLIAVVA